jgi:hypothetical protein
VYGPIVSRRPARHRAGIDDLAAPALDHLRRDGASDEERTRQIRLDDPPPLLERELLELPAQLDACVVDEDVDLPRCADAGRDRVLVRDVERHRERTVDSCGDGLAGLVGAAVDPDARTGVGQGARATRARAHGSSP